MTRPCFAGALLLAALPLFCQTLKTPKTHELLRFSLNETPEQIVKLLGRPDRVDDSTPGYQSWQYEPPADEPGDDNSAPAWFVCIRMGDRRVLSITRNFDKPQDVDELFPAAETEVHHWRSKDAPSFDVRLRHLSGEALLLAMGTAKAGERTTQLMLIRQSALKTFMPWLAEQLR